MTRILDGLGTFSPTTTKTYFQCMQLLLQLCHKKYEFAICPLQVSMNAHEIAQRVIFLRDWLAAGFWSFPGIFVLTHHSTPHQLMPRAGPASKCPVRIRVREEGRPMWKQHRLKKNIMPQASGLEWVWSWCTLRLKIWKPLPASSATPLSFLTNDHEVTFFLEFQYQLHCH